MRSNDVAPAMDRPRTRALATVVAAAGAVVLAYAVFHGQHEVLELALAVLVAASAFDADGGAMPLILLLGAVALGGAAAALDHRLPWLVLAAVPLAYIAAKSREAAIGWGDVLAVVILTLALPFDAAITAVIAGSTGSLLFTLLSGSRSGRMTPFFALAGALMLWLFLR